MAKAKFFLKKPNQKKSAVWLSFHYNGNYRLRMGTGISVETRYWSKAGTLKHQSAHMDFYRPTLDYLANVASIVENFYLNQRAAGKIPTTEAIKAHLQAELAKADGEPTEQKPLTFFEVANEFRQVRQNEIKENTLKRFDALFKSLRAFEKRSRQKISFESFDMKFYDRYTDYLLNHAPANANSKKEKGMVNDSVAKYIKILKQFLQWAAERGHHSNTAFQKYKATYKSKNDIVVLTETELNTLAALDLSQKTRLERVRDVFIFGCHTGQRWSDIEALNADDVKGNVWDFTSKKTGKRVIVPFAGFAAPALAVLEKYGFQLPKISPQKFNDYLKEVGKLAGIEAPVKIVRYSGTKEIIIEKPKHEYMSSHMARRTCVTILLQRGIPATTVMKLTGHSDIRTLMKYEQTGQDELAKALEGISLQAPALTVTKNKTA